MTLKRIIPFAMMLSAAIPSVSQVQLFEAEVSGIVPYAGFKWNSGITEMLVGAEYTIDGRISLGFNYSKPLEDTLSFDPELRAYSINPYGIFEFIEPDNLKTFSFAIRADYISEGSTKANPTPDDVDKLNYFRRTLMGGGPIFALRIFSSDKLALIPSAAYQFFYVSWQRNRLIDGGLRSIPEDDATIWHDLVGSCAFRFAFNEFNGISFEPKITLKFGEGRLSRDMLNVAANLGYVKAF